MIQRIASKSPETPVNTISGGLYALVTDEAERIIRLSRGVYILKKNEENSTLSEANPDQLDAKNIDVVTADGTKTVSEDTFYAPFAEWLKGEGEASQTVKLGGNILKGKWGTSDVIGVLKPLKADPIQFPIEIVFAEIKIDPNQPIIAFGQAIAYRLFSHKSYIVMPETIASDDLDRLEALSVIYGLGLVTFSLNPEEPKFVMKIRAQSVKPDTFYINQLAKRIREALPEVFEANVLVASDQDYTPVDRSKKDAPDVTPAAVNSPLPLSRPPESAPPRPLQVSPEGGAR